MVECTESRTPPGVRELKLGHPSAEVVAEGRRTPPGVRELKLIRQGEGVQPVRGRTPPGVRELKLGFVLQAMLE